jgi:heat shock protein HtpX
MYEQIARNKRDSVFLVAIIVAVLLTLGFAIGVAYFRTYTAGIGLLGVFGIVAIVWSLIGYYGGSGIVLAASRAQQVTRDQAPVLWDVVEEMSIAGGIPMPAVYVINDVAPNAFATGRDPKHASVAVTAGLLQMMSRDELQGVVAHEMSHVRNFDIRFATLVGVLVGMVALIADFFLRSTIFGGFGRRGGRNGGGADAIFFLIAIAFAILAPFFALLVQMAISRHREYLADASGVELTRNPLGLAHALQKIAGDPHSLRVATRATAHLFIANPLRGRKTKETAGLFDTHPPIQKRIDILLAMAHAGPDTLTPPTAAPQQAPQGISKPSTPPSAVLGRASLVGASPGQAGPAAVVPPSPAPQVIATPSTSLSAGDQASPVAPFRQSHPDHGSISDGKAGRPMSEELIDVESFREELLQKLESMREFRTTEADRPDDEPYARAAETLRTSVHEIEALPLHDARLHALALAAHGHDDHARMHWLEQEDHLIGQHGLEGATQTTDELLAALVLAAEGASS